MAKAAEYREMAGDTLAAKIKEMETNLFNSRLQATLGKLENTAGVRGLRRDIARSKTVLREKEKKA